MKKNTDVKIALCGEIRVGKDTVSEFLESKYGAVQFAFGDELKKAFHYLYPWVPRLPKPHKAYQLFGQLMRYVHGDDYWINLCFDNIRYVKSVATRWSAPELYTSDTESAAEVNFLPMITDLRQPNELERLREEGYTIIRVECPLEIRVERMKAEGDDFDPSVFEFETENYVKDFDVDYVISNTGTLDELYDQVESIMSVLLEK
jgi:dephospho-CoA kinase